MTVTPQAEDVVVKVTLSPDEAVAVMVKGGSFKLRSGSGARKIV